jgi:hypothetical protein
MRILIVLGLSAGIVAQHGLAASAWVQGAATFESPVRSDHAILGGESVWRCTNATCAGRAPGDRQSAQRYCRELARWGGPLKAFQSGTLAFDSEALRTCNERR